MKVDVVLISYNQEQYIAQAVESILMQRVQENVQIRVIIADDCSMDKTLEIIKSYEEKSLFPFVYLSAAENMGHVRNYQRTFAECIGDYVAILEGDDYWTSPNHIQMQVEYLERHRECVLTTTTPIFYDGTYNATYYNSVKEFESIYTTKDFLQSNCIANMSACVIRNSILINLSSKIYNAELLDWILYITLSEYGVLIRLKQITSIYRVNAGGFWTNMNEKQQNDYRIKILTSYDELLDKRYHVEIENTKSLLANKKSYKQILKQYIPSIFLDLIHWILPPVIFKKRKKC